MADEVVKGATGFTLTSRNKAWKPETGWQMVSVYAGPQATHEAYADTLIQQGAIDISITTGVPCQIVATFPLTPTGYIDDNKAIEEAVWELIGEPVEKRMSSHGKFNQSTGSGKYIAMIDAMIKSDPETAAAMDWDTLGAGLGDFNKYRDLTMRGVDSFTSFVYRVRATVTISRISQLKASYTNVGKVVAWSDIKLGNTSPSSAKFTQPTLHYVKMDSAGSWADASITDWLVYPPCVRWKKGMRKWEITQEWVGAVEISGTLYDGGSMTP